MLCLINGIILCFSMYNWIFARLSYYFLPYSFVLLPYILMKWPEFKAEAIIILWIFSLLFYFYVL